jgi:prepilin-type N-terminal cleavage/methylation domain-containing protein
VIRSRGRPAFTLVELLVVITIAGILISLLLPSVQMAREAARQLQCKNNLKQIALGWLQHEEKQTFLPVGGWGYCWVGEPNRGFDLRQPGGWNYNVLPYLEQGALHDLGINEGMGGTSTRRAFFRRVQIPVATFICPSRRPAIAYPYITSAGLNVFVNVSPQPVVVGRSDYAANAGECPYLPYVVNACQPGSLAAGDNLSPTAPGGWSDYPGNKVNGVVGLHVMVKLGDITDGTSNTYMVGEKNLDPDYYSSGTSLGDNQAWDVGWTADNVRIVGIIGSTPPPDCQPLQDTPGSDPSINFGSAHPAGFGMAFCDGSVAFISYSIDAESHRRLGARDDGQPVDAKKIP